MITSRAFWNHRALQYDQQVGPLYEDAYRRTAANSLRHLKPTDRILEFACGTGIVTLAVAPHVAHIRAIDIAEEMVSRARTKATHEGITNVDITQTDLFDPELTPGGFDAVMAFNVLLYVDDLDRILARIRELLKPDGVFLSATDCLGGTVSKAGLLKFWRSRTGKMPYVGFFSQRALTRKIAGAGFEVLHQENLFPSPPNLFVAARKSGRR